MAKIIIYTLFVFSPIFVGASQDDSNWRLVSRVISECENNEDIAVCFKMKAVNFLDRLIRTPNTIQINDYFALSKGSSNAVEPAKDYDEAALPRNMNEKSQKLDELLWGKLVTLFQTKSLQFNFPDNAFQGRKDDLSKIGKKGGGYIMIAVMFYATMMKMGMAGIAALAGKALLVAKVALTLAAVIALKKLGGGGGGGDSHPQVVYATAEHSGGGGGGGWSRNFGSDHGQNLAYNAHV